MPERQSVQAAMAGTIDVGGDLTVNRLGFGAMRITGAGIWGQPTDRTEAKAVLRRAIEPGGIGHRADLGLALDETPRAVLPDDTFALVSLIDWIDE